MCPGKMHADEVDIDVSLVGRLLAEQFPEWAGLPLEPVSSAGTDNAIYRLGDDMAVRLPRIQAATAQVDKEHRWLPKLAPHLPLAIPVPLGRGRPALGYPWHWSIYPWLKSENATTDRIIDLREAAEVLAGFVATWETALEASAWLRPPVWVHGDLAAGNLLVERGELSGVIDFGGLGVGDPACDLMVAWTLFSGESRDVFRAVLGIDDAMWARGRGWALSWALIAIPYYLETNAEIVRHARHAIAEVLADS